MEDKLNTSGGKKSKQLSRKGKAKVIILVLIIVALAGGGVYFANKYNQAQKEVKRLSNPQEAAKQATKDVTDAVGKLVEIPTNETPTLATVSDASKLKNQSFFANAENGDKVLIFAQARKAILYRPSTNKVIEIAPVSIGSNNNNTTSQTQQ